ncbi:transcriptional regulator, GntR family [Micromonospora matsumotoense]|uniref:Transcriptional regulator, GntR family n=1 Tax=Micromonospora matsumotoense TaxID=121616 RepID=A0A1C5ARS6_9ACTN|nr:GntR family transcriptional regulator [Micromonospora matsumotoense]SCF47843.1 transcriptional regulator, GntR family [Micromonospora matsumotoense]
MTSSLQADPQRVGEVLYRTLRDRIISGALRPGARLSVPALAEEFHVSRSPVRDAVIRLVQENLVVETMNRGAEVARVSRAELVSLYEAREVLEGAVARLATERYDAALRRTLLALLAEHRAVAEQGDFGRHLELDAAFHRAIRQAAQSPVLARMLDSVQSRVLVAMRSTSLTGGMVQAVHEHQAIFEAIGAGDPEAAEEIARAHIRRLKELLRAAD